MSEPRALVEHFFRHEFGRIGAVLTRSLGVRRLDLVEEVVQAALAQAVGSPCEVSPHGVSRYQARVRFVSSQSEAERWQVRFPEWTRIWNIIGVTFTPGW